MSNDVREPSSASYTMHLPPLIPISSTEPTKHSDNGSERKISRFSIDCILSEKNPINNKSTNKLINGFESNNMINTKVRVNCDNSINSKFSESSKIPSYTCMIAQAILSSRDRKFTLGEIYEYIERKYPAIEDKVKGWRNCVRHNLSLNECFIKIGPSGHGRGNNWTVHPSYIDNFLRGHFRKRMASRRKKGQVIDISSWHEAQLNEIELSNHQMSPYQQNGYVPNRYMECVASEIPAEHHWHQRFIKERSLPCSLSSWKVCCSDARNHQHFPVSAGEHYQLINHTNANIFCFNRKRPQGIIHPRLIHRKCTNTSDHIKSYDYEKMCYKKSHSPNGIMPSAAEIEDKSNACIQKNFIIHIPAGKKGQLIQDLKHTLQDERKSSNI